MRINSTEYWNHRFQTDWESNSGRDQTAFFMELLFGSLKPQFYEFWNKSYYSLLDIGCATGDSTPIIRRYMPEIELSGYDISTVAIEECKRKYGDIANFYDDLPKDARFDIAVISNVAEHFEDPWGFLADIQKHIEDYMLVLVPFEEEDPIDEHEYVFDFSNTRRFVNEFYLVHMDITDCQYEGSLWQGKQILLCYKRIGKSSYFPWEKIKEEITDTEIQFLNSIKLFKG